MSDFVLDRAAVEPDPPANVDTVVSLGLPVDAGPRRGDPSHLRPGHEERMLEHSHRARAEAIKAGHWSAEQ
jgi:hypothetical protein